MVLSRRIWTSVSVMIILVACLIVETDARRKILRGRKTLTRQYYRGVGYPGWLKAVSETIIILVVNGIVYLIANKFIINRHASPPPVYRMEHEV